MGKHIFPRSRRRPVVVDGELLKEINGRDLIHPNARRWFELSIVRAGDGKIVLAFAYRVLRTQRELDVFEVHVADGPGQAMTLLENYDPTQHVLGYPPEERFAERQKYELLKLRQLWGEMVRQACEVLVELEEP